MQQIKWMLKGGLITLVLCLAITLTVLVMSEINQTSQAQTVNGPASALTVEKEPEYAPLTDARPQRDITTQRFAPLEAIK